jgi:hypothetical protein
VPGLLCIFPIIADYNNPTSRKLGGTVTLARQLARKRPKGGKRSLREIATELAQAGHCTAKGTEYAPMAIRRMLQPV